MANSLSALNQIFNDIGTVLQDNGIQGKIKPTQFASKIEEVLSGAVGVTQQIQIQGTSRYQFVELVDNSNIYQTTDLAINSFNITVNPGDITVYLPEMPNDGARNFIIRINVTIDNPPNISFVGKDSESCTFESEDTNWQTLSKGINIFSFMETAR